jgi:hypothetical protein
MYNVPTHVHGRDLEGSSDYRSVCIAVPVGFPAFVDHFFQLTRFESIELITPIITLMPAITTVTVCTSMFHHLWEGIS